MRIGIVDAEAQCGWARDAHRAAITKHPEEHA
jgi:hypothetical protein